MLQEYSLESQNVVELLNIDVTNENKKKYCSITLQWVVVVVVSS